MSIQKKLAWLGGAIVFTTLALLIPAGVMQTQRFSSAIQQSAETDMGHIARGAYDLVRSQDASLNLRLDTSLAVFDSMTTQQGGITLGKDRCSWNAIDQLTQERRQVVSRRMLVNGVWLGQNESFHDKLPVLDSLKALTGAYSSVFERIDDAGDLLRVATTVPSKDGTRAVGTYVPATTVEGAPNPMPAAILRGESFQGNSYVVNSWFVCKYKPVYDARHRVIGAVGVGIKQESVPELREALQRIVVGTHGHVSILLGEGKQHGTIVVSPGNARDGESLWNASDTGGSSYMQGIVENAMRHSDGQTAIARYVVNENGLPVPMPANNFREEQN